MAIRTIVQDGDPILKKVCRPVTSFDAKLGTLLDGPVYIRLSQPDLRELNARNPKA